MGLDDGLDEDLTPLAEGADEAPEERVPGRVLARTPLSPRPRRDDDRTWELGIGDPRTTAYYDDSQEPKYR